MHNGIDAVSNIRMSAKAPLRFAHELVFSIYVSGVLILANDAGSHWMNQIGDKPPWVLQMKFILTRDLRTHSLIDDPKLNFAFAVLWTVSALGIFVLFRLLARSFPSDFLMRNVAGIVAIIAFPLACMYAAHRVVWTSIEVAVALRCAYLYILRGWPRTESLAVGLCLLHFLFWAWVGWAMYYYEWGGYGGVPLLWPGFRLTAVTERNPTLIYPCLGFLSTLIWGVYVRKTKLAMASDPVAPRTNVIDEVNCR